MTRDELAAMDDDEILAHYPAQAPEPIYAAQYGQEAAS